jgi:hypothetical protein
MKLLDEIDFGPGFVFDFKYTCFSYALYLVLAKH